MAKQIKIKDLVPEASNSVNTTFIVLDKGKVVQEGKETACLSLVADETAAVHFQMWGTECVAFKPGDIIRLTNGIFSYTNQKKNFVLRAGRRGMAEKVGEFTMLFVETPNMSEIHWVQDATNSTKWIQESVISPYSQVFQPLV